MLLAGFYILLTYLLGSTPFGLLLARVYADVDPREGGSRNIGATNVRRLTGDRLGALTLAADALKGFLPTLLAPLVLDDPRFVGAAALAAFVGHCWSAYLEFRGGKGVATAAGVTLALSPAAMALALGAWLSVVAVTRRSSLGALVAAPLLSVLILWLRPEVAWVGLVLMLGVLLRHTENIRRLLDRREPPS